MEADGRIKRGVEGDGHTLLICVIASELKEGD
jgi:hypothetical protein